MSPRKRRGARRSRDVGLRLPPKDGTTKAVPGVPNATDPVPVEESVSVHAPPPAPDTPVDGLAEAEPEGTRPAVPPPPPELAAAAGPDAASSDTGPQPADPGDAAPTLPYPNGEHDDVQPTLPYANDDRTGAGTPADGAELTSGSRQAESPGSADPAAGPGEDAGRREAADGEAADGEAGASVGTAVGERRAAGGPPRDVGTAERESEAARRDEPVAPPTAATTVADADRAGDGRETPSAPAAERDADTGAAGGSGGGEGADAGPGVAPAVVGGAPEAGDDVGDGRETPSAPGVEREADTGAAGGSGGGEGADADRGVAPVPVGGAPEAGDDAGDGRGVAPDSAVVTAPDAGEGTGETRGVAPVPVAGSGGGEAADAGPGAAPGSGSGSDAGERDAEGPEVARGPVAGSGGGEGADAGPGVAPAVVGGALEAGDDVGDGRGVAPGSAVVTAPDAGEGTGEDRGVAPVPRSHAGERDAEGPAVAPVPVAGSGGGEGADVDRGSAPVGVAGSDGGEGREAASGAAGADDGPSGGTDPAPAGSDEGEGAGEDRGAASAAAAQATSAGEDRETAPAATAATAAVAADRGAGEGGQTVSGAAVAAEPQGGAGAGGSEEPDGDERSAGGGESVVPGALRTITIPEHDPQFWDDLAAQLADEPQLRLRPRAAVRPITQPPPVIDDRLPFDDGDLRPRGRSRSKRRRRVVVWLVAIALSVLVILTALEGNDDPEGDVRAGDTTTTAPAGGAEGSTGSTGPAAAIDPAAPLTPGGVGPLTVGTALRDLQAAGSPAIVVDQPTFTGTGGTCFDATVTGVPDLVLRFRSPDPAVGVADPADGILASVTVDAQLGSLRATEAGITLSATEDEIRAAYPEGLSEAGHDFLPGGHIFTYVPPDSGNGIAFITDGAVVTGIAVGASDIIGFPEGCPT